MSAARDVPAGELEPTAAARPAEGEPQGDAPPKEGCPPEDVLVAVLEGRLTESEVEALHDHLDTCTACFALLASLASGTQGDGAAAPPAAPDGSAPRVGDVLAGRYEIERFVGTGGMGVVLAAQDLSLRRPVAIKLLPKATAGDAQTRKRLLREAHAVAALAHPGIVRIHDVEQGDDGRFFVVMELVAGESLRARLRRDEVVPVEGGVRLAVEVARALGAAHRGGVIHRDIKPDNIMIRDDGRAVLLDFGIAKLTRTDAPGGKARSTATTDLTVEGAIIGTPAYMAPEQAEGRPVSARTDQFALGVVAYELLTGKIPWRGQNVAGLLASVLRDDPRPPSTVRAGLPRALDAVLARALAKAPEGRWPDVDAFADALADAAQQEDAPPAPDAPGGPAPPPDATPDEAPKDVGTPGPATRGAPRGPGALRRVALWAGAAGLLLAATLAARGLGPPASAPSAPPAEPSARELARAARPRVAVLGFENTSGQPAAAWLSTALEEMLATDLAAGDGVRVIPAARVAQMRRELGLGASDTLAADTLAKIRTNLAADVVVYGAFVSVGDGAQRRIRLDVRAQDAASGEMLALLAETGAEAELFDTMARASGELRLRLGLEPTDAALQAGVRGALPSNLDAARLYGEGLDRFRRFDLRGAQELLERAVAGDPDHPLAHAALAAVLARLGYDERALAEVKRAFELSGKLGREHQLVIEGQYREALGEWERAIQVYTTLFEFFSNDIEHGLRLAQAQVQAQKRSDALATLDALRSLPPPLGGDPRLDAAEARLRNGLGDVQGALAAARRAADLARGRGARLLEAEARALEARALANMGDLEPAERLASDAKTTFEQIGDPLDAAQALTTLSLVHTRRGRIAAAAEATRETIDVLRAAGERRTLKVPLANQAHLLVELGQLDEAGRALDELETLGREFRNEEADGNALVLRGNAALARGRPAEAGASFVKAVALFEKIHDRRMHAWALSRLGQQRLALGDLAGARARHEQALKMRADLGLRIFVAESWLALGHLALEERRPGDAERLARQALEVFREERSAANEALALSALARALLDRGDRDGAREAASRAAALADRVEPIEPRLAATIASARVAGALRPGDPDAATRLDAALAQASERGWVPLELEARLARAELLVRAGDAAAARSALATLQRDAEAREFRLVARKASVLAGTPPTLRR